MKKPSPIKKEPSKKAKSKSKVNAAVENNPKKNKKETKKPDHNLSDAQISDKELDEETNASDDDSMKLVLSDGSDESPVKKTPSKMNTKQSIKARKVASDSSDDSPVKKTSSKTNTKKSIKPRKVSKKAAEDFIDDEDDKDSKPAKSKIVKTSRQSKSTSKKSKPEPAVGLDTNLSEDDELLDFIENNGGKLEEPKPLFDLNADGSLPELPKYVYDILEKDFGHKSFRPHQAESILRIACGLSTVVVLSTGEMIFDKS